MTTLREAAQQALEAMRCAVPTGKITLADWYKSITALRAALAEPVQEPVCAHGVGKTKCSFCSVEDKQPVQEPVAHKHEWFSTGAMKPGQMRCIHCGVWNHEIPPQRKPLTEEEISSLWDGHVVPVFGKNGINPIVFARAIERAHGIT